MLRCGYITLDKTLTLKSQSSIGKSFELAKNISNDNGVVFGTEQQNSLPFLAANNTTFMYVGVVTRYPMSVAHLTPTQSLGIFLIGQHPLID